MPTTALTIITDAIARSIENDAGGSELAEDQGGELLRVLNRLVQRVYRLASLPAEEGGWGEQPYFQATGTVTVGSPATTPVALPATPRVARLIQITTAGGTLVSISTLADQARGMIDFTPAVILADQRIKSANRSGDPVAASALTVVYAYLPGDLTLLTHYIGATTPDTPSTSQWPSDVGDQFLIDMLDRYLALKDDGNRPDLPGIMEDIQASAEALAGVLRVNAANLVKVLDA